MLKKITFVIVGLVLTIGAVAAQQPSTPPGPAAKSADKTAALLTALQSLVSVPTSAPTDTPSPLTTVLDRYARMAAAGQRTSAPITTISVPAGAAVPTGAATAVSSDTLDAIRADLRALLGRLDALAHKTGGGQ